MLTAEKIIELYNMQPLEEEGGYFSEGLSHVGIERLDHGEKR